MSAEASTIADGIGYSQPEGDKRHHCHQHESDLRHQSPMDGKEQTDSYDELCRTQQHRGSQRQDVWHDIP